MDALEIKSQTEFGSEIPDLEQDLKKIETLAQKKYQENYEFSQWLKTQDPKLVDKTVHEISAHVSKHIDCTSCANCCKSLVVGPDYRDVSVLAQHFEMTTVDFKKKYMKKDHEGEMVFKQRPCSFLKNSKCSVYEVRPELCRKYPYLDQGQILENLPRLLRNIQFCPIVFNTYELLKLKFT